MFEEFKNLRSLTKTITFDLIPTEITKKNMEENNHILLHDLELNNKEYLVYEAFDKIFTTNNNNVDNNLFVEKLITLSFAYRCFKSDDNLKEEYNKNKTNLIKDIAKSFKEEVGNKSLFGDETMKILKNSGYVEEDVIGMFNKSRIESFIKTRKTAIDNIAKRIVSNIELMTDNLLVFNKLKSTNYVINENVFDVINNFHICLYKQEEINKYNNVISEINQKLNEDFQKNVLDKKYKFTQLQKTILGEGKSNFTLEQYKSVEDVRDGFSKLFELYNIADMYNKLHNVFAESESYNLDNIVVKNNKLRNLSKLAYGNINYIVNKIGEYATENFTKKKDIEKFNKQDFSIALLNSVLNENVFEKIKVDTTAYSNLFAKFCFCPIDSKEYFEHCLNFCTNINDVFGDLVKLFDIENSTDVDFNVDFEKICDFYRDFNKVFNCTRNFATKKNDYVKSFIINWGNARLNNPGWAETKIKENRCCLFIKNGKYYFGYLTSSDFEFEIANDTNYYCKMVNMQLGDLAKQCPRMVFTTAVKNHFKDSNETYIADNGFEITKEIYNIYVSQKNDKSIFENNRDTLIKYIDLFRNYIMNYYENNHYFDFSNIKNASEYDSLNDFYKDLSAAMYHRSFEYISDECIEKLQNENKLWLFQIYCQDFSEHKKENSNKNIHTLIFESFFSEENKTNNFPIRLNGGFEIRYRDAGLTDGFVHKKGSVLLNKNDKNGKRIPDSVYCKLFAYVNEKKVELTNEEKYYIENNLLVTKIAQYDIIKDRRYIEPKYEIHLPFKLNSTSENNAVSKINDKIDEYVKKHKCNIIGIDRGERNLLCVTVIDSEGNVIEHDYLDCINNVNYNELMTIIEKDRQNQRKNWKEISQIKNVKKGFVSYAVKAIVDLVEKYNAIICLEGLNDGFMQSRVKIEKSIYREFVKQLINKLSYMIINKKSSVIDVKQLAFNDCTSTFHNGIIYYVDPSYTSKIDNETGFANLFDFSKITNNETRKKFFKQMDDIKFEDGVYRFQFKYSKFAVHKKYLNSKTFVADSWGTRIKRFKNEEGYWDSKEIDLTQEFNKVFEDVDVNKYILKDVILNDEKICSKVFELFKLIVQLRNTDKNNDYLVSPIKKGQLYYNTESIFYARDCEDEQIFIQCNPDMEASYNIAIKAMLKIYHNKPKNEDYFEYFCSR